jgi:3-oxoacyl-[acyl-carrier protein] reductase
VASVGGCLATLALTVALDDGTITLLATLSSHSTERNVTRMGKLDGKVAVVSGSGRGIGRETALKLAGDGASVVVNDLDAEPAKETVAAIEAGGGRAVACVGSVTDEGFAERFVEMAVGNFGGLDIIVNNAGYTWDSVIQKMTDEQWDAILDVHLKAPFRILRAAQPVISAAVKRAREAGEPVPCRKVVNISSIAGLGGNAGQANYAAAKAGVTGLTKTMAKEWGRYNVTVNALAFGLIKTRLTETPADGDGTIDVQGRKIKVGVNAQLLDAMERTIPLGRGGTPADAAGAVYLFCIPESDYVSGQTLVCGGGFVI